MRVLQIFGLFIFMVAFAGCQKADFGKGSKNGKCQKYIYEDLVYSEACQCIVSGKVKYVKGKTLALVDYGDGTCDNLAIKTVCYEGDCYHPKATKHTITIDCQDKKVEEGEVAEDLAISPNEL